MHMTDMSSYYEQDISSTTRLTDVPLDYNGQGHRAVHGVERTYSRPPPPYSEYGQPQRPTKPVPIKPASPYANWLPRNWNRKIWIGIVLGVVLLLVIIIVAITESLASSAYPSYKPLKYHLVDTYLGPTFFDYFDYFYDYDPAQGFVHYSNPDQCKSMNLTFAGQRTSVLRVDNRQTNASTGRHSARISSKKTYNQGLFIFDVLHTPYGCASWPAVWLTDASHWPQHGEIDVIESVNRGTSGNHMALHTTAGCDMDVKRKESGTALYTSCDNSTNDNAGCGVRGPTDTFGTAANQAGGGVYAMEYRAAGIRIWFFPRARIPRDITELRRPNPHAWGPALADFPSTNCDIASHFRNLSITVNIDVCGSWAGAPQAYSSVAGCPGECATYAATHPEAFDESYWEFVSFRVYKAKGRSALNE